MYKTNFEQEVGNRKKCTANKLIDAYKKCHLIRVCVLKHYCREYCSNCQLVNALEMAEKLDSTTKKTVVGRGKLFSLPFKVKIFSTAFG